MLQMSLQERSRRILMLAAMLVAILPSALLRAQTDKSPAGSTLRAAPGQTREQREGAAEPRAQVSEPPEHPPLGRKQRQQIVKDNFEKLERDVSELADLAKSLQEDLQASNENVLSLAVLEKADRIEKLGKQIKKRAKGI